LEAVGKKRVRAPGPLDLTTPAAEKTGQKSIRNKKTSEMIQILAWWQAEKSILMFLQALPTWSYVHLQAKDDCS